MVIQLRVLGGVVVRVLCLRTSLIADGSSGLQSWLQMFRATDFDSSDYSQRIRLRLGWAAGTLLR